MKFAEHIVDLVGHTPLVKLTSVTAGLKATVLAKVEYLNPGGSVKDRIALRMVEAAEASGALQPGGTIIEPTSGNTGVGLALVAQRKGYKCIFVCPDKVSEDKRNVLAAYGAEVVVTPTSVAPDDPRSYYSVSDRLAREIPGGWKPDQYSNQEGPASHYETTGPEIWADTDGKVTHFVAGVGTGGTITGTGRYLHDMSKDRPGGRVSVVGADPTNSVYSGGTGRPYLVEGVGEDFWPSVYDPTVPDEIIEISDAESFDFTRRLAREEGLLVGGSCGMAVAAAVKLAQRLETEDPAAAEQAVIVVLLPDGGRGYLSKIFDDGWMRDHGFLTAEAATSVGDVLAATGATPSQLPHVRLTHTVAQAIAALRAADVPVAPVVGAEPPVMAGEVAGSISAATLLEAVYSGAAQLSDPVAEFMTAPLPIVGHGDDVQVARAALKTAEAVLVLNLGRPVGLLTRHDLLHAATAQDG